MKTIRPKYKTFKCEHCLYECPKKKYIAEHIVRIHTNTSEIDWIHCNHCPSKFKVKSDLLRHMIKHDVSRWKKCRFCSYMTPHLCNLYSHMRNKHQEENKWIQCEHCPFKTPCTKTMHAHQLRVHESLQNVEWFSCTECSYRSKYRKYLNQHVRRNHLNAYKYYECEQSTFKDYPKSRVQQHMIETHKDESQMCDKPSTIVEAPFRQHIRPAKHTAPNLPQKKNFKCRSIRKEEVRDHVLTEHISTKACTSSEKCLRVDSLQKTNFNYVSCNLKSFQNEKLEDDILTKHVSTHIEKHVAADSPHKNSFKCDSCNFETVRYEELRDHIFIKHVSTKSVTCYKCELCKYRTLDKGDLKEHVLEKHVDPQHTDWFPCEMCSCKFRHGRDLKKHVFDKHIL